MEFVGFYNFKGGGSEVIVSEAGSNHNIPDAEDKISNDPMMFFSGQFTNLSRKFIHINLKGVGNTQLHKHDLRPYESINVQMIPLAEIAVLIHNPPQSVGFHGMGVMWKADDADEYAVMAAKSFLSETIHKSPDFNTDSYTRASESTASTFDVVESDAGKDFALYKVTIAVADACVIDLFWTDDADGNIAYIGKYRFTGAGSFVVDFNEGFLRNPNGNDGKLRFTSDSAVAVDIDAIGHMVEYSQ